MKRKNFSARGAYFTLILILTLVLLTSTSYSMWTDRIRMNFSVNMGRFDYKIGCCKVECGHNEHDNSTFLPTVNCCSKKGLNVEFSDINGSMNVWLKTHVENTGTIPLIVTGVDASATGGYASGLQVDAYYYGPSLSRSKCGRGHPMTLPPAGWKTAPIVVFPGETLIIWVNVRSPMASGDVSVEVNVNVERAT